jgi:hypothetical protein
MDHRWSFMPAIQATWEVEIGESQFDAGLGQKLVRPYIKNQARCGVHLWSHLPGSRIRRILVPGKTKRLHLKQAKVKKVLAALHECLSSKR